MKVAVFVYEYPPKVMGGLGTYASEITRKFVLLGHDVTVFTMNDDDRSLPTREVWRGIEIYRPLHIDVSDSLPDVLAKDIKKGSRGINLFSKLLVYNYLSASKLVNDLVRKEGFNYDIVVAHDWLSAIAGITVKKELGLPFSFHVHSTEQGRTLGNGSQVVSNLELRAAKFADKILTVSQVMKDELLQLDFPEEKIKVCYNGVDPEKYHPENVNRKEVEKLRASYGIEEEAPMILFVGRLIGVKGVDKLIMSMPHVLQENPNAKLVIVGVGGLKEYLLNLVNTMDLQDSVVFRFEFIPEEERILHYGSCDVAVFPSLYEPFGIVALEAMSMERPVAVGAAGASGMKEIVISRGESQCGFHVDPKNPADIARGITNSLADPGKAEWLGKNGRHRVLDHFTWDEIARKTVDIYREMVEG